jgi:uncharacterized phiE125 gp8 family phage protein
MTLKLITAQTDYAVSLDEAKTHLKELTTDNDAYIFDMIVAAQRKIEEEYDLSLNDQTFDLLLDVFPVKDIEIYMWPVKSVVVSYTDVNGVAQTVTSTNYSTDLSGKPARVRPIDGYSWPATKVIANAVQVRFITGFTSPSVIPGDIKQAIHLIIRDWFDNRADKGRRFTRVSEMILNKYRYR